jgi:plasmid replication initiation protein
MKKNPFAIQHIQEKTEDRHVTMHNALARGCHSLNLSQKRVISMALAKLDSNFSKTLTTNNEVQVRLSAKEFSEIFEIDTETAYKQISSASRSLLQRIWRVTFTTPAGIEVLEGQWLSLCHYKKHSGIVEITFHKRVSAALFELKGQFSSYKLKQASALRSIYAWRLFECLNSWKTTGVWRPTVDEFIFALEVPESCKKDFFNLKKRVIEPAVEELKIKQNLDINFQPQKLGRKLVGFEFKFREKEQQMLDL